MNTFDKDFKHLGEYYEPAFKENKPIRRFLSSAGVIKMLPLLIAIAALVVGAISVDYLGNDNKVEEVSEAIVKAESGVSINLDEKPTP